MNEHPPVSVLMPVYNAARYLAEAVESIRAQTFGDFELIAVDDGSTDRSLKILQQFANADSRVKIVSRPNTGIVGALNDGLSVAGGEFVARMDSDDLATPARFAKQLAAMQQDRECVALGSAVLFTDPKGRPLKAYRPPVDHAAIEEELARGNGGALIHPTVLFRRAALIQCGGYRQQYNFIEDLDLYVRLLAVGRLGNLPDVLLHYRQHANSVNHLKGSRSVQAAEIIAPLRQSKRLPPLTPEQLAKDAPKLTRLDDCYRKWALDAAEGQNFQSAWANAVQAVRRNPWEKANWSCLRYIYGCKRAAKTVTQK
ncbi:MAG: glycosyltransferase [Verrucomicrobiota bacterium]